MFEYLSMLCVMIAAKNSSSQQNQQKSIIKNQQHQHNSDNQQQQHNYQTTNQHLQQPINQLAAVGTTQEQVLDKHETRSEKRAVVSNSVAASTTTTTAATTQAKRSRQQLYNQDHESLMTKESITSGSSGIIGGGGNSLAATTCCSVKIQQRQQKFLAAAAKSATTSPNNSSSSNYNFATFNKTPTTNTKFEENLSRHLQQPQQQQQQQQQQYQQRRESSTCRSSNMIVTKNNINNIINNNTGGNLQHQQQLPQPLLPRHSNYNFNININQQQHQNQLLSQHHHHHHHNHQTHTMAHYKFHNDCQSSVLTYEQVKRLDFVMDQTVPIHGRGNFPTLYVKLKELIRLVKYKLQTKHLIEIRDVRLNGGAASYVLAPENSHYNDLDLIFGTDLSNEDQFDVIRDVVLECLKEFYPKEQQESHFDHGKYEDGSIAEYDNGITKIDGENLSNANQSCLCDSSKLDTEESNENESEGVGERVEDGDGDNNDNGVVNLNIISCDDTKDNTGHSSYTVGDFKNNHRHNIESNGNHLSESHIYDKSQLQHQSYQMPLSNCAIKEAYVHKMVKVNDEDRWSLISLGVQQSEANCCIQANCLLPATIQPRSNSDDKNNCQQKCLDPQHSAITYTNENEPQGLKNQSLSAQMMSNENSTLQTHYQINYLHQQQQNPKQQNHHQHQRKQSPNSIELKFVDRMRRKFEFSVDSFQIILDSLIQFYDYAPQSTIASQKILINSHPSSTMVNTRPLISSKRKCAGSCCNQTVLDYDSDIKNSGCQDNKTNAAHGENHYNYLHNNHHQYSNHHHNHHNSHQISSQSSKDCYPETKPSNRVLNASQSYYQFPIEPANSPSISSVASSSGCSSSSSVVSSSSSSLSCDEDHDDLYCDGDSPSSSSASTSSLLSSTTLSLLSSDGLCNDSDLTSNHHNRHQNYLEGGLSNQSEKLNKLSNMSNIQSKKDDTTEESSVAVNTTQKSFESTAVHQSVPKLVRLKNCVECIEQRTRDFQLNDRATCAVISENFYPTVIGRSEYGNFKEALYHLEKKLIATRSPEEIRGGGLLKYCNLLVKNYKPTNVYQIRTLERYMCSRFFIDFSDLNQQQAKLESYLANHFSDDPILKFDYLTILHNVVQRSTVCLMNHELRLTLNMIRDLAYEQQEQQQQKQQQHQLQQSLGQLQPPKQYQQVQQASNDQGPQQQQQPRYYQQKPVLIQSGVYRVKLVNYTLAKPIAP